jgi:CheY-like chemotaxis protein
MSAPSRPFAQLRLLIVDPQETSRALTTAALRRLGLRHVTQADGAASAAEVLRQAKLDLLLADWDQPLPGMATAWRSRASCAGTPKPWTTAFPSCC